MTANGLLTDNDLEQIRRKLMFNPENFLETVEVLALLRHSLAANKKIRILNQDIDMLINEDAK